MEIFLFFHLFCMFFYKNVCFFVDDIDLHMTVSTYVKRLQKVFTTGNGQQGAGGR